jgi:hypothetical protein
LFQNNVSEQIDLDQRAAAFEAALRIPGHEPVEDRNTTVLEWSCNRPTA